MKENSIISLGDINLRYLCSDHQSESSHGDFCHERFEIVFLKSACGVVVVEGKQYCLESGSLILINPFAYHRLEQSPESDLEAWSLLFSKTMLSSSVADMLDAIIGESDNSGKYYSAEAISSVGAVFERFQLGASLPDDKKRAYVEMLISELIILLSAYEGDSIAHSNDCLGARVVRYLNNHIEKNISLDKLARRFFVSKYHLCRAFKEYCGISVHSYINHKRIMFARQLIESGETASGAAEKVGFGDYSAFYRAYVKIVGKSPTAN